MVGAPDVPKPPEHLPQVFKGKLPVYTISDGKNGSTATLSMVSMNSSSYDIAGKGGPPIKRKDDLDSEKQPLSGLKEEIWWKTLMQVAVPFFIAGAGTIGAGLVLGTVRYWEVFENVSAIFVLVPALSGLKGNLDMCLASRLSTQANLGNMKTKKDIISMVVGNISLVQVQAITAGSIVAIFAILANAVTDRSISANNVLLLLSASVFTATTTCFVLDFVMVAVILGSHKFKVNPDNVATPLAASIGDVVSNSVLAISAQYIYEQIAISLWQPITLICIYFALLPIWVYVVYKNKYTKKVLTSGWTPVISALFISGAGGLVLDSAVEQFSGFEVFSPIINGIGGNLVSVHSSRLSTALHASVPPGVLPDGTRLFDWPWKTLFYGTNSAKIARMLIALGIFGQTIFMIVADAVYMGYVSIDVWFAFVYLFASALQIMILLYIAYALVHFMWKRKKDPDNASIPYLTAIGDLLGSLFLGGSFLFLTAVGSTYGD